MVMGSIQPPTDMSTKNIPGAKRRPALKAWQPQLHLRADFLGNVEALTFHKPVALHGLLEE
jgi:hypothetical protein